MTEDTYGAVVARQGLPSEDQIEPGQDVETYVLLDPVEFVEQPTIPQPGRGWDAHGWAITQAARLSSELDAGSAREHRRHRCGCPRHPSIATEYVDSHGVTWVMVGPERVPSAFRRSPDFDPATRAMPLHVHPNGSKHVEITTCRRCNQDWAVLIGSTQVHTARVRATRGATIAP